MRVAYNDSDDRAGLRGYVQFNKYTYMHTPQNSSMIRHIFKTIPGMLYCCTPGAIHMHVFPISNSYFRPELSTISQQL